MYKFVSKLVAWYDYLVLFRTFKICFRPSGRPACTLFIFIKTFYAYFYFLCCIPFTLKKECSSRPAALIQVIAMRLRRSIALQTGQEREQRRKRQPRVERARLWKASTIRTWSREGRASRHGRHSIVHALMRGDQVRATATGRQQR